MKSNWLAHTQICLTAELVVVKDEKYSTNLSYESNNSYAGKLVLLLRYESLTHTHTHSSLSLSPNCLAK